MVKRRKRQSEPPQGLFDSSLFRFGTRLILGIGVVLAILTLIQCTIEKPQSPQWDTQLTLPVVHRTYPMEELIRRMDQDGIGIDSSGVVTYSIEKSLDTVRLDSNLLSTSDLSYVVSEQVGLVSLAPPSVDAVSISLAAISGLASGLPGDSATITPMSFDLFNDMPSISTYSQATVVNGTIDVTVTNGLGVALDVVTVDVYDVYFGSVIATDTFPVGIPGGTTGWLPISLDGKTVSNSLRVNTHCSTPGGLVDSASMRYVSTDIIFTDSVQVSSAVAEIPALTRQYTQPTTLSESDRIDTALIADGGLSLLISNGTNLNANLTITIPDIVSLAGQPLSVVRPVTARQSDAIVLDVTDYRLIPSDVTVPQEIEIQIAASVPGTAPQQIAVNQADSFVVTADLTGLTFGSVTGVFDSASASFDNLSQDIDVPTGFDSVQFMSAILTLEVENGTGLEGFLDVQLVGDNGKSLDFSGTIAPAPRDTTSLSSISDSTVADFLDPIPSHIDVSGSVVFGDGSTAGTLEANDFVAARVRIVAPLEVIVNESQIETDVQVEAIDQDNIDVVRDHFIEGRFIYNITNHLPLGAAVGIYLGGDSATLYTDPLKVFDSLFITAAPVSPTGLVIDTASTGYREIILDGAEVRRILSLDTVYVGQELILRGTGGQSVKLTQNDYITVVGRLEIEYRFDGEF
ncbi:MAG TPA: hypothetical protein VN285_10650 [Candidatus Deferrimicrobium sp.]|nr:hypothetical protein [Candidatus Deferrimicrobium sp.]